MNAFTQKPDVSKFIKEARARHIGAEAATKRVMQSSAQHIQSKNADHRKAQIQMKPPVAEPTLRDFVLNNDDFALCQWDEAAEQWVPVPYATIERAMKGKA